MAFNLFLSTKKAPLKWGANSQMVILRKQDFDDALENFIPSLDENEIRQYERLQKSLI